MRGNASGSRFDQYRGWVHAPCYWCVRIAEGGSLVGDEDGGGGLGGDNV